jgi:anhydro-N-acetylmuramic acid kinase
VGKVLLIGIMSGTSADGVDAALVEMSGEGPSTSVRCVHSSHTRFDPDLRSAILSLCDPAVSSLQNLTALHNGLGEKFGEAALRVASEAGVAMSDVSAIASHGQTVWHQPETVEIGGVNARGTLQIGAPAVIAAMTGCRVVSDFRAADMAAGGQGAPLVPFFDWTVLRSESESRIVLNVGGIANITYLPKACDPHDVLAFDTGPGNMLIDALAAHSSGGTQLFDADGAVAARGRVCESLLSELLEDPFFEMAPPKSTGRERFGAEFARRVITRSRALGLPHEDMLATATQLTARTAANAIERWAKPVAGLDRVIVGGGGARNATLMRALAERLHPAVLSTHEEFSIHSDAKEAMAFALMAYETIQGRPSNLPSATGAAHRVILGSITPAPR